MTTLSCIPYAAGYADEGVCLGLEIGPYRILVDCGLRDLTDLTLAQGWDAVICSHAHTDHARGLLDFHARWPKIPIYGSTATAALLPLNWPGIAVEPFLQPLPWRTRVQIATKPDATGASTSLAIELWPAGHLPGAAIALVSYETPQKTYCILYTGDCFLSAMRLVEGLPLTALRGLAPDVVIADGTYGTLRYPHRRQQESDLMARLRHCLDHIHQPRIVFPAPIMGLGQELLLLLRSHYHTAGYPMTIWVDPTVAAGCDAYLSVPGELAQTVQNFAQHQAIFWDKRVQPLVKRLPPAPQLAAQLSSDEPAIFLVHPATLPSQYCNGFPGSWTVFLPEIGDLHRWQTQIASAPACASADWLDALKNSTASGTVQVETYLLTSHCDGAGTAQLIHNLRPRHIVFQHGPQENLMALADLDTLKTRYQVHVSMPPRTLELPLDVPFRPAIAPPPLPSPSYEGEITLSTPTRYPIAIALPAEVANDPRWQQLAETGLISAQWEGQQLVIRGVDPGELMSVPPSRLDQPSCAVCQWMRSQVCRQPESPLFNRTVALDGLCAEFTPQTEAPD